MTPLNDDPLQNLYLSLVYELTLPKKKPLFLHVCSTCL